MTSVISFFRRSYLFVLCIAAGSAAFAQTASPTPDAGRVFRDAQATTPSDARVKAPEIEMPKQADAPAKPDPAAKKIDVKELRIVGLAGQSEVKLEALEALVADGAGKSLTFAELTALADRITRYYAARGYDLARAYLPAQEIRAGVVTIAVIEGRIGKVVVENATQYPQGSIDNTLKTLRPGDVVRRQNLESHMLLLADTPGLDVGGVLKAGAKQGETDLVIKLKPAQTISVVVDFDNFGSKSTGVYRAGVSVAAPSATVLGQQLSFRGMTTGSGMSLLHAAWQTPLGSLRDKLSLSATLLRYKLGDAFSYLDAKGSAVSGSATWTHTFERGYERSVFSTVDLTRKVLHDDADATTTKTIKSANVLTLGLNGSLTGADRLASTLGWSVAGTAGKLKLDSTNSTTGSPQGDFTHINSNLSYQVPFSNAWSLGVTGASQYAGTNLDSGSKISLGGPTAVRAYPSGEAAGDRGTVVSAELRYAINYNWQASSFYDAGVSVVQIEPTSTAANKRHLAGLGLGMQYTVARSTRIKAALAWRTTADTAILDTDRKPRLWVNGIIYF